MHVLVTGGTGFLGAYLVRQLLDAGHTVRILVRPTSPLDLLGEAAGQVEHAPGDVTQPDSLLTAMEGVDGVFHAAAFVGFGGRDDREMLHRVNVEGTAHVVNAALRVGVPRVVHTSSMAAFGRTTMPKQPIDEETVWQPSKVNSEYAQSKRRGELEVQRGVAEGLDAVLVNPALIFGVGRPGDNTTRIAEQVRDGKLPAVPAGGTNVVDVRDVAAGHLLAMERGEAGGRYFLGSENLSWKAIMGTLAEAFGTRPPRFVLPPALTLAAGYAADAARLVPGLSPQLTLETARSAARFYRYDNAKAREQLGATFRPFRETAQWIAAELQ